MLGKRRRPQDYEGNIESTTPASTPPSKRRKPNTDRLTPLSDELLLRILSFLPLTQLLAVAPVSHRFDRLAADSQLWKALYYERFVLPRAMRIPGFREDTGASGGRGEYQLWYKGRRRLWADGRRGGLVKEGRTRPRYQYDRSKWLEGAENLVEGGGDEVLDEEEGHRVDWKRQYKIRHNWARGKCAVEELQMGGVGAEADDKARKSRRKMLVKVVEGVAFTADAVAGLRVWDLKTREILAQTCLRHTEGTGGGDDEDEAVPTSAAIDEQDPNRKSLDIALGFLDGSFGIWRYDVQRKTLCRRSRHEKSSNGELVGVAYSHPFLLTATESVLVSLYTLEGVQIKSQGSDSGARRPAAKPRRDDELPHPYLVTSLRSHTSQPPLALSIRKLPSTTIASIAYTFTTRQGWSIGIQDLHIKPADRQQPGATPEVISTRLAYSAPVLSGRQPSEPSSSPSRSRANRDLALPASLRSGTFPAPPGDVEGETGDHNTFAPTTLCYTHPYLLATLPDNTLILHLCTSTSSTLSISPGIRLWGHTSGISDAEITARGKAVSVSSRGEEMRVWELEGRPVGMGGRSVEIRPNSPSRTGDMGHGEFEGDEGWELDGKRNWVGFDDEMVIVLKEARGGRESLMVYDFT